jgi:hypothetical protein
VDSAGLDGRPPAGAGRSGRRRPRHAAAGRTAGHQRRVAAPHACARNDHPTGRDQDGRTYPQRAQDSRARHALAAPPAPAPVIRPSAPTGAVAPPGFKARELTGGGDALRQAARDGIGCRNADVLALTKAERAACAETLGEKNKNRPAMYAVIDPDKKAAFDGACKKDDDWCLYRTGKGSYPGIFALGKKKKIKGWDD